MATSPLKSAIRNYACAIGGSVLVAISDGMRNGEGASLKKAMLWLADFFESSPGTGWSIAALAFFAAASTLLVMAYKPTTSKESFLLGLGILAFVQSAVPAPQPKKVGASFNQSEPKAAPAVGKASDPHAKAPFSIMSSAFASNQIAPDLSTTDVWFIVEGAYRSTVPFISLAVYPADRSYSVYRYTIFGVDMIKLPPGRYHFEFTLEDYRSIVFTQEISGGAVGFSEIALNPAPFDSLLNALGPLRVKPRRDASLGEALSQAQALCAVGNRKGARDALSKIPGRERSTLDVMYGAKDRICLN